MKVIKRTKVVKETLLVLAVPGEPDLVDLLLSPDWILDMRFPGDRKFRFVMEYEFPKSNTGVVKEKM